MKSGDYEIKYLNKNELEILKYLGSSKNLVIPNEIEGRRVTRIGEEAFCDCSGLTSITIPESVTSIGNYAFYNCIGLTSITIPDNVTNIGKYLFYGCTGLTSITIGNRVTSIGDCVFYRCAGLTNITIPNSVTSIGEEAFRGCSGLTSITIPESVTNIGHWAFSDCSGLTNITIPNSVTSIGHRAFSGCTDLTNITIPDSVTSIVGDGTFRGCSGLTSIDIKATKIKSLSYFDCPNLTEIIAHKGCSSLLLKEIMKHAIEKDLNSMIKDEYLEWIERKQFDDVINYAREKERVVILARLIETYHKRFEKSNIFEI